MQRAESKEGGERMDLSIIVPVYNMASDGKLTYCIDSLLGQSLAPDRYEIIAVDDCSTDGSYDILLRYAAEHPGRVRVLRCPENRHQGGAKNLGLSAAAGDWIGFMDADDWAAPEMYASLLARAEETGADMVGCDYSMTGEHSFAVGQVVHNNRPEQTGVMDREKYRQLLLDPGSLVVKIYRRRIVFGEWQQRQDTQIFPEHIFYEDNAVSKTWMLRSRHFEYIPEPYYYYYQHGSSTVHTVTPQHLEDRKTAGRLMLRAAETEGYLDEYRQEMEFAFTVLFYVNTLFSAMPRRQRLPGKYAFTKDLAREMRETFPDFQENPYYLERIHPEERRLIAKQMRSHLRFYMYYRLLWAYRDIRAALKRQH